MDFFVILAIIVGVAAFAFYRSDLIVAAFDKAKGIFDTVKNALTFKK